MLLLFLSMHNSSLHQRLFQNPRHILNLRTFIVFCGGLLGGHLKKTTQWFFFLAAILIFVFFSIELSLCFTRLSSSIAFGDRFVRRARNLKALKKKSRVEKVAVKKHDVADVDSLSRPLSNGLKFLCKLPLTIFLA